MEKIIIELETPEYILYNIATPSRRLLDSGRGTFYWFVYCII